MIVYFTGTGNSRYVAEMLADILDDSTLDASAMIKAGENAVIDDEKPLVFVSPVYVSAPPLIFSDFIRRMQIPACKKAWFIMTCAGGMGACPAYMNRLCLEKGLKYMGTAQIIMPQNYLVFFKTHDADESMKIIEAAKPQIRTLAEKIKGYSRFNTPDPKGWELWSTELTLMPYYKWFIKADRFTASDACVGCGKCVRSCPLNNISLAEGKPVWGSSCTHCVACINLCPTGAIEYGRMSLGKPRYRCLKYKPEN